MQHIKGITFREAENGDIEIGIEEDQFYQFLSTLPKNKYGWRYFLAKKNDPASDAFKLKGFTHRAAAKERSQRASID